MVPVPVLPVAPALGRQGVAAALVAHGSDLARALGGTARFTPNDEANSMVVDDAFAFLVAVVADQGIRAERAWAIPFELKRRVGEFSAASVAGDPEAFRAAFAAPPKLHRFVNQVAGWVISAARIVLDTYGGDASSIWAEAPSAADPGRPIKTDMALTGATYDIDSGSNSSHDLGGSRRI